MLGRIRIKLTIMSTIATGIILLIMSFALLVVYQSSMQKQCQAAFESAVNSVVYKLQADSEVDNSWLAKTEAANRLIISVYDNGKPLSYKGSWKHGERQTLIALAEESAVALGVEPKSTPMYYSQTTQASFMMKSAAGESYRAAAYSIPANDSSRGLIVLGDMKEENEQTAMHWLVFAIVAIAGLIFLCVFDWWFAGHALKPVEDSRVKQSEFIASASHELRSPLAVIRACASMENARASAALIDSECARMNRLIEDLSIMATAEGCEWNIKKQPVDADTLLIELFDQFSPLASQSGHTLSLDLADAALPEIHCDGQRLAQVLAILINNAISHTSNGTRIVVRAIDCQNRLSIEVSDNGEGIPMAEQYRIFDRFYRADKSRTDKKHFGLGLSIAKELCNLQGHALKLKSHPGEGSTFTLDIPLPKKHG